MKLIFQFFLPILIGNLFQQLYSFVDSMVVGKGIGDVALAAVGNTSSVHFLILGFAMGLTGGLGICISHSFGANDIEKLRKEIAMSVYICLAIGIVITVGSLFWMRRLFVFLQTPEDMMTDTLVYFGTILAGSTVTIFNNFAMTLLRSVGNSKVPLASMIVSSVVNIVLDLLFVFPFGMGVFGAALATVLAQVVSALYCLVYIRRAAELLPRKTDWRADGVLLGALVGKGLPVAVMNSVTAVGGMVASGFCQSDGNGLCRSLCCMYEGVRSVRAAGYNTWTCTSDFYRTKLWSRKIRPDQTGSQGRCRAFCPCQSSFCSTGNFLPEVSGIPDAE